VVELTRSNASTSSLVARFSARNRRYRKSSPDSATTSLGHHFQLRVERFSFTSRKRTGAVPRNVGLSSGDDLAGRTG
jgi:hypothetical protein